MWVDGSTEAVPPESTVAVNMPSLLDNVRIAAAGKGGHAYDSADLAGREAASCRQYKTGLKYDLA